MGKVPLSPSIVVSCYSVGMNSSKWRRKKINRRRTSEVMTVNKRPDGTKWPENEKLRRQENKYEVAEASKWPR
jgi:hypothetical protein